MKIAIHSNEVLFEANGTLAGRYVLDDRFKPYLHPLRTPAGHEVTVCMPGDHRHHKGLMFGLRCADLNFWEEDPGTDQCGVQATLKVDPLENITGFGLRQELEWKHETGERPTYREVREILCRHEPTMSAFVWTWNSHRTALRAHRLVKSQWSLPLDDGRMINYHGLGIRLPWMWAFGGDTLTGVEREGHAIPWKEAAGTTGPEMAWWGRIDGHWTPPLAAVTLRQNHNYGWFVLKGDFSYLAVGPSNNEELEVATGQIFSETYQIIVQDR